MSQVPFTLCVYGVPHVFEPTAAISIGVSICRDFPCLFQIKFSVFLIETIKFSLFPLFFQRLEVRHSVFIL